MTNTKRLPAITPLLGLVALAWGGGCGDQLHENDARTADAPVAVIDAAAVDAAAVDGTTPDTPVTVIDAAPIDGVPIDTPVVVSDLVVHYTFEGATTAVADVSGGGHDAVLSDVSAWSAAGRTGRGLALTGTQFVSLPNGAVADVHDFTVAVWVKVMQNTAWTRIYDIGNGLPDPAGRFMFLTVSGFTGAGAVGLHSTSYGGAPANEAMLSANALLPTGVWKHVTLTASAGHRQLYVDGFPISEVTGAPVVTPGEMEPISPSSWIGKSRFPDPGLNGSLDDFRIYNRVLTATEIENLAWPKTDYSYWRFDEATGTTAADSSDRAIATALATGVTWTAGRLGGAIDLPGGGPTGPHVVLSTSPLAGCTNQLTVAAWIKVRALTNWSRIFDFGTGNTAFIYLAPTDGAGMHFAMVSPNGVFDLVSPTPPVPGDNTWHHVAVSVDPANLVTVYVDGASVATGTAPVNLHPGDFAATTENWLGRSRFPDPALNGSIDELRVSCRAYTADEIKMLARR